MAEQKPRVARTRKKTTETSTVAGKAAAKRSTSAEAAGSATPPTAKKKATKTPRRSETVKPADVAVRAYLLWEQGEPGDATDHWLRAEQELVAA